ncbi:MAG TPA: hypothetical protein VF531_00865, partial [Bacillota bacterium]
MLKNETVFTGTVGRKKVILRGILHQKPRDKLTATLWRFVRCNEGQNGTRPSKMIMAKGGMTVLFLAIFFLVFALFIVARVFRGNQAIWLGLVLFTFGCCILGLVGLVPRFGNYRLDGLLSLPMDEPGWAWAVLARLSLYNFIRFRLWSAVGFLVAFIGFAISYSRERLRTGDRVIIGAVVFGAALMVWNYDPGHLFEVYKRGAILVARLNERRYWELS